MTEKEKKDVLDNINGISAYDIYYKYIKPGYINLDEMMDTGNLGESKRKEIITYREQDDKIESDAWIIAVNGASITSYTLFLDMYPNPNGKYYELAQRGIKTSKQGEDIVNNKRKDIYNNIKNDFNKYGTGKIKVFLRDKDLSLSDLTNLGIPTEIIQAVLNFVPENLELGNAVKDIPLGYTEVYFWGRPGSGKTCALSGILSYMHNIGVFQADNGPGFYYMNQLKNIFRSEIGALPEATDTKVTQYLPFRLTDRKGFKHPIALIELSGEIFRCYLYVASKLPIPPDMGIKETFDTTNHYLSGPNRKIHFFVIDLSQNPRTKDHWGFCQDDYLLAAQQYFSETDIFKNSTDAIYIIATKSDILQCAEENKVAIATGYMHKNYPGFVNVLKAACANYKINDNSDLNVVPFSLGKVYFNDICQFNSKTSGDITKILQQKTVREKIKKNWFVEFFNR